MLVVYHAQGGDHTRFTNDLIFASKQLCTTVAVTYCDVDQK